MNERPFELTVGQAAELLGTSEATVRRMVDRGALAARLSPGGHRLIPREVVEAKKLQLDNPGDPLGLGVADKGGSAPTPAVERPAATEDEHQDAGPMTLEEVQRVALQSVSWDDGSLLELDFPWTARSAERARRYLLRWFEKHYREGLTRRQVEDLALDVLQAWVKHASELRPSPPPAPEPEPAPEPAPTLADFELELLKFRLDLLRDERARGVVK